MIIEFIGQPGSGKTFLAKKVFDIKIIKNISFFEKIKYVSFFFFRKPLSLFYLLHKCLVNPKKKRMVAQLFYSLAKYGKAKKNKAGVFDENLIQLGFFLIRKNFDLEFKRYLKKIPLPDKVFFVSTERKKSFKMMNKRGYDNLEKIFGKDEYYKICKRIESKNMLRILNRYVDVEVVINKR